MLAPTLTTFHFSEIREILNFWQPGRPGEIWLLYDFDPLDEASGEVVHLDEDSAWGYLLDREWGDGEGQHREGFMIANSFDEFGPDFQWNIQRYFDRVCDMAPTAAERQQIRALHCQATFEREGRSRACGVEGSEEEGAFPPRKHSLGSKLFR
jgi:hypothetical protein